MKSAQAELYGCIDYNGNEVIAIKWNASIYFREGMAAVKLQDKWGFINKKGDIAVPIEWVNASSLKDGEALVEKNWREFYLKKDGDKIIVRKRNMLATITEGVLGIFTDV